MSLYSGILNATYILDNDVFKETQPLGLGTPGILSGRWKDIMLLHRMKLYLILEYNTISLVC